MEEPSITIQARVCMRMGFRHLQYGKSLQQKMPSPPHHNLRPFAIPPASQSPAELQD